MADRNLLGTQICHQDQQLAVGLRVFERMKPEVTGVRFAHWQLKYLVFCLTETFWETGKTNQTKKQGETWGRLIVASSFLLTPTVISGQSMSLSIAKLQFRELFHY